jgi:hypothetical protein
MTHDTHTMTIQVTLPGVDPSAIGRAISHVRSWGDTEIPCSAQAFAEFVNTLTDSGVFIGSRVSAVAEDDHRTVALFCGPSGDGLGGASLYVEDLVAGAAGNHPDTIWDLNAENVELVAVNIRAALADVARQLADSAAVLSPAQSRLPRHAA